MSNAQYLKSLEAAQENFNREIAALADKIRTEVIIPICQKHKLRFISGMGTFYFVDEKGNDYAEVSHNPGNKKIYQAVKGAIELLNREVSRNQVIGYWVKDVG